MLKKKFLKAMPLIPAVGLLLATTATATTYSYNLDRFEISGNNSGGFTDEFNGTAIDSSIWDIDDPTVTASGGFANFHTPGSIASIPLGGTSLSEMSYLNGEGWYLHDGDGDYQLTSSWASSIPALNQFYVMNMSSMDAEPNENVMLGVANFDATFASLLGTSAGPAIFFGWARDVEHGEFAIQGFSISPSDITGNILLQLNFLDALNQFATTFSLDGGATYLSPFSNVTAIGALLDKAEVSFGAEAWEVQHVPLPSSLLLLLSSLAGLGLKKARR
jgi:hypothetical protein